MEHENYSYDLFISYNIADASIAQRMHDDLIKSNRDIRIYCFQKIDYKPSDYWTEIQEALRTSRYFCLLDSPAARNSTWVIKEWEIAWKLYEAGKIEAFIPCLLTPLGNWRNSDYYSISPKALASLPSTLPKWVTDGLKQQMGKVFFGEDNLTAFLKRNDWLTFKNDLQWHLRDKKLTSLIEGINRIRGIDLSGYTTFDHEDIYKSEMLQLCEACGFSFGGFSTLPSDRDFEDELEALNLDRENREILLQDYQFYLNRANSGFGTARRRLEILREECSQLGFRLPQDLTDLLLTLDIPEEIIDDLAGIGGKLYTAEYDFQNDLWSRIGKDAYDKYYTSIYNIAEKSIKFFSLEISLAFLLVELGELELAYELVAEIVEEHRFAGEPRGWYALGRLEYYHKKNAQKAIAAYDRALEIIEDTPHNASLRSNKILILYDKIKSLIDLGEYYSAKKILDDVSLEYQSLPEYKYAKVRLLISFGQLREAELILEDLYRRFQNENETWTNYKLTDSKIRRLQNNGTSQEIIKKLKPLIGKIFFSKDAFEQNLEANMGREKEGETADFFNRVVSMAKYHRGFNIQSNIIATLENLIFKAFVQAHQPLDALYHIERCHEILPDDLWVKADLGLIHHVLDLPAAEIIEAGLALKTDKMDEEDRILIGRLYYLKGDERNAKKYYPQIHRYKKLIMQMKSDVDPNWVEIIGSRIDELKQKSASKSLTPFERMELNRLVSVAQKYKT